MRAQQNVVKVKDFRSLALMEVAIIPGPSSGGLINLFALLQNSWLLTRDKGRIHWGAFRILGPSLGIGVLIGFAMIRLIPTAVMPILISLSTLASLITLALWRSGGGRGAGAINAYAGVGGPPVASNLISQGWAHGDFLRILQLVFIGIDIVSLPILGLPALPWWFYAIGVGCLLIGTGTGSLLRRRRTRLTFLFRDHATGLSHGFSRRRPHRTLKFT